MPDHIHILVGLRPYMAISDLVRDIKTGSSGFVNEKKWVKGKFSWQTGFGAFSHTHSSLDSVIAYIQNQEEHHRKKAFRKEYEAFLTKFNVQYETDYLFEWID
jgi:REP element-mobilizing transposase RayT